MPEEPKAAEEARKVRPVQPARTPAAPYVRILLAVAAILFLWLLGFALIGQRHLFDLAGRFSANADMLGRLSALMYAAAGLVLSGILVVAPLLSLSLHQSYDAAFDVIYKSLSTPAGSANYEQQQALARDGLRTFEWQLRLYNRWINPVYYGLWGVACLSLLLAVLRMVTKQWARTDVFDEAMTFFIMCAGLCVLFAVVSVLIFASIRPGVAKLELFTRYLSLMINNKDLGQVQEAGRHRKLVAAFVLGGVVLTLMAVGALWPTRHPESRVSVAVNSQAVASGPLFVASDLDIAGRMGLQIREKPFAAGRLALDALIGGQVDVATVAETPVLLASVNHPDLRIILTTTESEFRIVAARSRGIQTVGDLRGKKIGTFVGTSADYYLATVMASARLSERDATVINLQPPDMVAALVNGSVDAISVWEPFAQKAADLLGNDAFVIENPDLYVERFNLVTTSGALSDLRRRKAIQALVRAVVSAGDDIAVQSDQSIDLIANRIGMSNTELRSIWGRFHFDVGLDSSLICVMQSVERWAAVGEHRVPRDAGTILTLIDPSVLRSIDSRRVHLASTAGSCP